jgi:hypothetical protein
VRWVDGLALTGLTSNVLTGFRAVFEDSAPDVTPPTITLVSPADGTVSKNEAIVFELGDDVALSYFVVLVVYADDVEVAYDGADPSAVTRYTVTFLGTFSGKQRYSVIRRGGWRASPTLRARALDTSGNLA